jgi:hypothetical protein
MVSRFFVLKILTACSPVFHYRSPPGKPVRPVDFPRFAAVLLSNRWLLFPPTLSGSNNCPGRAQAAAKLNADGIR